MPGATIDRFYAHYKGEKYEVLLSDVTNEADKVPVIVYQSLRDGKIWVRPKTSFEEIVSPGISRFHPITELEARR